MATRREWLRQLGWMVLLWAGGVVSLALVALSIKTIMGLIGMR
jgi:hypothetical protein